MTPAFLLAIILAVAPTFVLGDDTSLSGSPAPAAANPGAVVGQVYQFALLIGGLLAFGAIVYGGIKYTVSAGNPSGKSDGREWIYGALWGLLLLLGSYLILHTINPNRTNLNLPTLTKLQPPPEAGFAERGGSVACGGATSGICPSGQQCANEGTLANPLYKCDVVAQVIDPNACGGMPPNSHYGDCPPPDHPGRCINGNDGTTKETVQYRCVVN